MCERAAWCDDLTLPVRISPSNYLQVQLTLDFRLEAYSTLKRFNPDIIHAATPGVFVIPAILCAAPPCHLSFCVLFPPIK